ncbi:RAMP superfamily CRISPR-associated protein [Candidatus Electrothrix sp.]|uniref:RAMP superfamily CRISPR-associated protein n=1 Tax=Candidatus Electrothrix sp. TaxID=2170559 RepID=UPI0040566978
MLLYVFGMISLSYTITSLTPIVTGDNECRNTELLATGILGSLRYQYWLLKAMQAWQADPENPIYPHFEDDHLPARKGPNDTTFRNALAAAGPVVQLFGATNWKKMFRLEIAEAPKKGSSQISGERHVPQIL